MKNWLEEIEEQEQQKEALSDKAKQRVLIKREKVAINYSQNGKKYDDFINKVNELVQKVNILPKDERNDFVEIDARLKENEFDNKLTIFSSSKRVSLRKMRFFFFGKEVFRFKHIRVAYFSVSKEMGRVDIEYKEKYLPKGHHEKYTAKDIHYIYELNMDVLTKELAYKIINWLAFKQETTDFFISKK